MQVSGTNYLHLREVEAFDRNSVNVALNKPATQSSTSGPPYASIAVNCVICLADFFHTTHDHAPDEYSEDCVSQQGTYDRRLTCACIPACIRAKHGVEFRLWLEYD